MQIENETNLKTVGKIGDRVYYYWNGRQYSRSYFIPNQPGTDGQIKRWMWFKLGVMRWQALTQPEKDALDVRAVRLQFSGFNLYMREHMHSIRP